MKKTFLTTVLFVLSLIIFTACSSKNVIPSISTSEETFKPNNDYDILKKEFKKTNQNANYENLYVINRVGNLQKNQIKKINIYS